MNTTGVARRVEELAYAHHPETIAIDSIGIGAGVVDELNSREVAGIIPLAGSGAPHDRERFANLRAELYWGLRECFFHGDIQLTDDPLLAEELAQIRYVYTSSGRIQIEAKEALKRRLESVMNLLQSKACKHASLTPVMFRMKNGPSSPHI